MIALFGGRVIGTPELIVDPTDMTETIFGTPKSADMLIKKHRRRGLHRKSIFQRSQPLQVFHKDTPGREEIGFVLVGDVKVMSLVRNGEIASNAVVLSRIL
jgi:hypothetical protein